MPQIAAVGEMRSSHSAPHAFAADDGRRDLPFGLIGSVPIGRLRPLQRKTPLATAAFRV